MTTTELSDSKISAKIAEKMGQIHSLHIPVSKEADWIFNTMNRWLNNVDTIMNDIKNNNKETKIQELQKRLSEINLRHEANWIRKVAETEAYPVVFCHNDLQEGNILFRQNNFVPPDLVETLDEELQNLDDLSPMLISCPKNKMENKQDSLNGNSRKRSLSDADIDIDEINGTSDNNNNNNDSPEKKEPELMIIDFEYCAYNYRAFDIANHFLEWTYDYTNNQFPYFHYRPSSYPNEEQIDNFLVSYLMSVNGSNEIPSVEEKKQLLKEISLFSLASHLFWGIWAIVNIHQEIEFGYWEYADIRLNEYFKNKEKYMVENPHTREFCNMELRRK